jgi:hypothetical protein
MKPNPKMLFGNIFDDRNITPNYLARFTDDCIAKLIQNNIANAYNSVLVPLQNSIIPLRSELGQVDVTLNTQVGKTATVDSFIADFTGYMKENYVFVAAALGGDKTPAFGEFYPNGKTEYSTITKTKIPTIMERLKTIAVTYQAQLGATISNQLQDFQTQWTAVRGSQLQQKSALKTNRSDRSIARKNVEMELLKTIHFIGNKFPGDEKQSMTFFDFNLLFGARHKSLEDKPPVV